MTEQGLTEGWGDRLFNQEQIENLKKDVLETASREQPEIIGNHLKEVKTVIDNGLTMIQTFEEATYQKHPSVHLDTDVVYIDSGPGPYSYNMLEPGKTDLEDVSYHKWPWSRKMDRARNRAAYVLASMITAKRIEKETGIKKPSSALTSEDYRNFGPYLMFTSTAWQNSHIRHVHSLLKKSGLFKIPDDKLIMYDEFINRQGEKKPIVHSNDQIEGLNFPLGPNGNSPRRVAFVTQAAHLMRVMHILGKYPDSIPDGTILQPFLIPTPPSAVYEYARAELLGTIVTIFNRQKASLIPYDKYQL